MRRPSGRPVPLGPVDSAPTGGGGFEDFHGFIGNRRQLLTMITYALGVNALSLHVRRQGLAPPQAA